MSAIHRPTALIQSNVDRIAIVVSPFQGLPLRSARLQRSNRLRRPFQTSR